MFARVLTGRLIGPVVPLLDMRIAHLDTLSKQSVYSFIFPMSNLYLTTFNITEDESLWNILYFIRLYGFVSKFGFHSLICDTFVDILKRYLNEKTTRNFYFTKGFSNS